MSDDTTTEPPTTEPPFQHIKPYWETLHFIKQMQEVLDDLAEDIETAQWIALGGRGAYSSEEAEQTAEVLAGWQKQVAEQVEQLPDPYDRGERWETDE